MYVQHYTPSKSEADRKLGNRIVLGAVILIWFVAAPLMAWLN